MLNDKNVKTVEESFRRGKAITVYTTEQPYTVIPLELKNSSDTVELVAQTTKGKTVHIDLLKAEALIVDATYDIPEEIRNNPLYKASKEKAKAGDIEEEENSQQAAAALSHSPKNYALAEQIPLKPPSKNYKELIIPPVIAIILIAGAQVIAGLLNR